MFTSSILELVELAVEYIRDSPSSGESSNGVGSDELRAKLVAAEVAAHTACCMATTGFAPEGIPDTSNVDEALSALQSATLALDVEVADGPFGSLEYRYVGPAAGVKTKVGLLHMLDGRPNGTRFEDVSGAYPNVALDVHRLWKRGRIVAVQNPQHTESTGDLASSLKGLVLYPRTRLYGHRCCMKRLPGVHHVSENGVETTCDMRALVRRGDAIVVSSGGRVETFRVDNFDGVRHVDTASGELPNGAVDQVAKLARYSVSSGCDLDAEGRERPRTMKGEHGRGDSDNVFTARTLPLDRPCEMNGEVTLYRFGVANDIRALWHEAAPDEWPEHAEMIAELEAHMGVPVDPLPRPRRFLRASPRRRPKEETNGSQDADADSFTRYRAGGCHPTR